jgi:ParB family transcriptional regulator, chromosome partitioning protein
MHVADCVIAYGKLRDDLGLAPQDIAMRFGVAVEYVRRVLKLSALSPVCLAALAKDEISIATAQTLTLSDDHDEQVRLLEQYGDNDWHIKRALTETKVDMNSGIFRFVGADAYMQAGGTITRDLFDARDEGYADHPDILQSLAMANAVCAKWMRWQHHLILTLCSIGLPRRSCLHGLAKRLL